MREFTISHRVISCCLKRKCRADLDLEPRHGLVPSCCCTAQHPPQDAEQVFAQFLGSFSCLCWDWRHFVHILPFRRKQVSEINLEHDNTTGVTARNCCRILRYVFLAVSRVEICHDCRDRRSCKIFANCVNFSRKPRVLLYNLHRS